MDTDIVMIALDNLNFAYVIGVDVLEEWERPTNRVGGKIPSEIGKASRLETINFCK